MNTERLKRFRTQNGISQKKFAGMLGISQSGYDVIEKGLRLPSLSVLIKLSSVTGYTLDELVFEDSEGSKTIEERYFFCKARLFEQLLSCSDIPDGKLTEKLKNCLLRLQMLEGCDSSAAAEKYRLALKLSER